MRYQLLRFSQQQVQIINQRAQQQGGGFLLSAFFLAATACAVAHIQQQRKPLHGDMLIPIPQDRRRKGAYGPLVGNQLAFLFYRILQAALSDVQNCTIELVQQMTALMRSGSPSDYLLTMGLFRRVPGPMYRCLLTAPTSGLMGSFFYTYTGDSLWDYWQLFKQPVYNAVHYPPNVYPPGLTFVYAHFHGALLITIGYMEEVVSNNEVEQLIAHLRSDVLVVGAGAAGIAAAVAAAESGLQVVLVERYGFVGGLATAAMVGTICGLYYRSMDGPRYAVKGFCANFCRSGGETQRYPDL